MQISFRWKTRISAAYDVAYGPFGEWVCLALAFIALGTGCATTFNPGDDGGDEEPDVAREIEEADIVKYEDGFLYLANPFTGLRLIDVRDMERPVFAGRLPLTGRAVELFLRDDRVYLFTAADFFSCAGSAVGFGNEAFAGLDEPDYSGSRMWVVDVSNKSSPSLLTTFDFIGFVTATRRVGDVIYAAGNLRGVSFAPEQTSGVFVTSIDVTDPQNVVLRETEVFPGSSLDIHVSENAMYTIGYDPELFETTLVTYVDISDDGGDIVVRDQFRVPGTVESRFNVDEFDNVFRIVTDEFVDPAFARVVALYTYDVSMPDNVTRLARLAIVVDESLRAVRFDGPRGYAVTFREIDPLFVLDLADPTVPTVAGQLEVPGFSTHLVPLGDRLVGVGFDDTAGFRPAVSLYDVSDPARPSQLSRIVVGERFTSSTTSEATVDEKALRVIPEAGLILLPFSTFDFEAAEFVDALQLIQMEQTRLSERAVVRHRGLVRRADLQDERIWVLSDLAFQSVEISDLDEPRRLSMLDIAGEQELLDAGLSGCADSARYHGQEFFPFFPGGPCGVLGLLPLTMTFLGLCGMRGRASQFFRDQKSG